MKSGQDMFKEMIDNASRSNKDGAFEFKTTGHILNELELHKPKTQPVGIPIKVKYKNWQENISIRTIIPQSIYYGHTDFHKNDQWLMDVWDVEKDAQRTYAMLDIMEFIKE